jgi:hypothetical protein
MTAARGTEASAIAGTSASNVSARSAAQLGRAARRTWRSPSRSLIVAKILPRSPGISD